MKRLVFLLMIGITNPAWAGDVSRKIIAELDPIAPTSAQYEQDTYDVATSKWAGSVDFNLAGVISTGPEFWTGTFVVKGDSDDYLVRREDLLPGERHKLDSTRLRWNFIRWEHPTSMRGWYLKGAYSYTRINSRANRYTEDTGEGDAVEIGTILLGQDPDDETDLITDIRHGMVFGFGNRWLLVDQKVSVTLGASWTGNFKRTVEIDSKDPNAREDYNELIESLPETKMSTRPLPEANLGVGYAF